MKTAIITGAASGIGKAIGELFHKNGYRVVGIDRQSNTQLPFKIIQYDISQCSENNNPMIQAQLEIAQGGVDVLVNNAAVQIVKPIEQVTDDDWETTLKTNVLAPFWLIRYLLPSLRRNRGCVVNIGSIHARLTKADFSLYAVSKGALLTMTKALAVELAPQVRVNAILPAATDTPMLRAGFLGKDDALAELADYHPLGRLAAPEEIAQAVYFLASDQAGFITGTALEIDGGIGSLLHDPENFKSGSQARRLTPPFNTRRGNHGRA